MIILYLTIIALLSTTVIVVFNYFTAPVLKVSSETNERNELISVLVPARNEETNIIKCLGSIIGQDYKNIEVIVLDDESGDNTFLYASELAVNDKRIRVVKGDPLPDNFTGKNWACYQLSLLASGSYLLLIDADVELEKDSITSAINEVNKNNLNLLSVFPSQKMISPGEWLLVPLMNWLLLTFLPLRLVYSSPSPSFAAANGQFMLFDRVAYNHVGGHKTLGRAVTEDIEFVKLLKRYKYRVKTYLGGDLVYCRMYSNLSESLKGFSKNFYPGMNLNPFLFITLILFYVICFTAPLFWAFIIKYFFFLVILIFLQRILISVISRQNLIINVLLHPFQMIMLLFIGVNSVYLTQKRKRIWKGRTF